ncbi:MAG: SufB/SufD family protein [Clostridia bacterium]
METLKINETPKRTSRNFNINNIKLENIEFPEKVEQFENVKISGAVSVDTKTDEIELAYGLGDALTEQVKQNSNKELKLIINNKIKEEIEIDFEFDNQNLNLIENLQIVAKENAKATIIIKYESENNIKAFHNGVIRVDAKANSNIEIILVNLLNNESNNFISMENKLEENAKLDYCIVDFGGQNSITNYYSNVLGNEAENNLNTIYLGNREQLFDLNYIADLRGKKSKVNIEAQGALKDNARKHFKGTIDFKKGCKKAIGAENENCMLLSDKAKSLSLPMLLCSEEEVEGNHSSSSGKIGNKELFYIMSRGFEQKEAIKLMVRAKFNQILETIKNEKLKETILIEIDKRLD